MKQRWQAAGLAAVATFGLAGSARAELSVAVRTAAQADQNRDEITAYVKGAFDRIALADKKSDAAREELCRQVEPTNVLTPSSSFTAEYTRAVLNNLPAMAGAPDVQKRLMAALVLYRFCGSTPPNPQLVDAVIKVMTDKSPAVALWGVKAAGLMLPQLLQQQFMTNVGVKLAGGVIACVKANETVGPLVQDAYNSLSMPDPAANQPALPAFAYAPAIDAMNKLIALRADAYRRGVPPYPQADRVATSFFARGVISGNFAKGQKEEAVKQMVNLLDAIAGQEATASGNNLSDLNKNVALCAGVLNVTLLGAGNPAAGTLTALSNIKANAAATNLSSQIADVVKAIRTLPEYKTLPDPAKQVAGG